MSPGQFAALKPGDVIVGTGSRDPYRVVGRRSREGTYPLETLSGIKGFVAAHHNQWDLPTPAELEAIDA